jgi:hypothetical protein
VSHIKIAVTDEILRDLEHPLGCARNVDDFDCTCGLEQEVEEDGFVTVHPVIEGYAPGHYKSWQDIPDVERDE